MAGYGISYLTIDRIAMYCIMQCWKGIMALIDRNVSQCHTMNHPYHNIAWCC